MLTQAWAWRQSAGMTAGSALTHRVNGTALTSWAAMDILLGSLTGLRALGSLRRQLGGQVRVSSL